MPRALIVVTSHGQLGDTGKSTGYYLPEVTHPYYALREAGVDVDIASVDGGEPPMDESSRDLSDPENARFLSEPDELDKLEHTIAVGDIDPTEYDAVFFAGGHGTMWDFPYNPDVQRLAAEVYERGGVVAAVCHGPAALLDVELSSGERLIEGKRVAGFSNDEEQAVELQNVVPFLLESRLIERGARYEKAEPKHEKVVVDGRLITGQNPASATEIGHAIARALS